MSKDKISGLFIALFAEADLVVKNFINIIFITRFLGADGTAAYELVMPSIMVCTAVIVLCYSGTQTMCFKDYGARDMDSFSRHKNAGYTWVLILMTALTLVFALFREPVLDLLGANDGSETLRILSEECYLFFLWLYIPQGLFSIIVGLLYLEERLQLFITIALQYAIVIGGSVYVTVTGPSMRGYVTANALGVGISLAYILLYFLIRRGKSLAAITGLRFKGFKDPFLTGLPDFMEYAFVAVLYLVENLYLLARFSEKHIAGIGITEAIDNIPETLCVGFSFLVTAVLGTRVGRYLSSASKEASDKALTDLRAGIKKLAAGAVFGGAGFAVILIILANPLVGLFLQTDEPEAARVAVLMTISCAFGYVFYLLNTGLVCYYKIVGTYVYAHILFFAEALALPLVAEIVLGELLGIDGFCFGGSLAELTVLILNVILIWIMNRKFPRSFTDLLLEGYLRRLAARRGNREVQG